MAEQTGTHSPLPWQFVHGDDDGTIAGDRIEDAAGAHVTVWDGIDSLPPSRADMKFIVRACNPHAALVEELRRFVEYYAADGRSAQLGNGEAFQHWDRSRRLLAAMSAAQERT